MCRTVLRPNRIRHRTVPCLGAVDDPINVDSRRVTFVGYSHYDFFNQVELLFCVNLNSQTYSLDGIHIVTDGAFGSFTASSKEARGEDRLASLSENERYLHVQCLFIH